MKISRRTYGVFGISLFSGSLFMFYLIGGWKLPVAMILFAWAMNIDARLGRR